MGLGPRGRQRWLGTLSCWVQGIKNAGGMDSDPSSLAWGFPTTEQNWKTNCNVL